MSQVSNARRQDSPDIVVEDVALPLKNLEFLIDDYLLLNGCRLDTETRFLLAGVRDCLGKVLCTTDLLSQSQS